MIRRLVQAMILFVGVAMALFQFPFFQDARRRHPRLGRDHRRRHRHRRPGAHRQPRQRRHDRLLAARAPRRLHQRRRRVRHGRGDPLHLHVHPHVRRSPGRHPQRGLRQPGRQQLLDGLGGQHGRRRLRRPAGQRRSTRCALRRWTIGRRAGGGARGQEQQRDRGGAGRRPRHPAPARLGARPARAARARQRPARRHPAPPPRRRRTRRRAGGERHCD